MLFTKIKKDLSKRKLRSILTIIGLSISVLGITGVAISNSTVLSSTEKAFGISSAAAIELQVRTTDWSENISNQLDELSGITDHEHVYRIESSIVLSEKNHRLVIWGINFSRVEEDKSLYGIALDEGSDLPKVTQDELLIDSSAANSLDLSKDDILTLPFPTNNNSVNRIDFTVTGLARAVRYPGFTFTASIYVWMSIEKLQSLYESTEFNHLYIKSDTDNKTELEGIAGNAGQILNNNDVFVEEMYIFDIKDDVRVEILSILNTLLSLSIFIGFIIGGVLTTSTIQMAIASEKKDISIMKIIGAKKRHIFFTYIGETLVLGFLGGILGIILSIIFAVFLVNIFADPMGLSTITYIIPLSSIFTGFLIPIIISMIFAIPIILGSISVSPIELFRKSSSSRKKQKRGSSRFFTIHTFSLKNLTRKRVRLGLNLVLLTIAVGSVVGFTAASDSVSSKIITYFDETTRDIEITFPNPDSETLVSEFVELYIEDEFPGEIKSWTTYWRMYPIRLYTENNEISADMSMFGIHADNPIWQSYDIVGNWPEENESQNQVVITNLFIDKNPDFDLSIGSEIILGTPFYNETFQIIGIIDEIDSNAFYNSTKNCMKDN